MEIIFSLDMDNVHCAACLEPIKRGKACVYFDGQYYHGPCVFSCDLCKEMAERVCTVTVPSITFGTLNSAHPDTVPGLRVARARHELIARYDTVIDIRVQTITAETFEMIDRIRYMIPLKTEGDIITINVYETQLQKWDAQRSEAVAQVRMRVAEAKGTWAADVAHDAQPLDKTELRDVAIAEKEIEKSELVGDQTLPRDADAAMARDDALLGGAAESQTPNVVDPVVLDIDPSLNNPRYESQVKRALVHIKNKEFFDAKKLQYLRVNIAKQAAALKTKASTSVIPYFNEKSSGILSKLYAKLTNLPSFVNQLPAFNSIKEWVTKNTLDRISLDMVRDKIFKVGMSKVNGTPIFSDKTAGVQNILQNLFAKIWHVIEPAVKYALNLAKDAMRFINLDSVKGAVSNVIPAIRGIVGGVSNSKVLSNLNLNNISSVFSSLTRWIEPAFKQVLKLVMQLKNLGTIVSIAKSFV